MDCPVCKKPMVILEYQNVEIDFCVKCHGCWLDKGELGLILNDRMELPDNWTLVAERKSDRTRTLPRRICRSEIGAFLAAPAIRGCPILLMGRRTLCSSPSDHVLSIERAKVSRY